MSVRPLGTCRRGHSSRGGTSSQLVALKDHWDHPQLRPGGRGRGIRESQHGARQAVTPGKDTQEPSASRTALPGVKVGTNQCNCPGDVGEGPKGPWMAHGTEEFCGWSSGQALLGGDKDKTHSWGLLSPPTPGTSMFGGQFPSHTWHSISSLAGALPPSPGLSHPWCCTP